jgi:hypothetical protein
MNKFTRLTILGSAILIGLVALSGSMIYFGIQEVTTLEALSKRTRANYLGKTKVSSNSIDTIRVERIIEKQVHDTIRVEVACSRKHFDHSQISVNASTFNKLDSSKKDTQFHGN